MRLIRARPARSHHVGTAGPGIPPIWLLAARLPVSMPAREVMRSTTAVPQGNVPGSESRWPANVLVREPRGRCKRPAPVDSLLNHGADSVLEAGRRFRWSEAEWWAWEDLNQRPHPDPKIHGE